MISPIDRGLIAEVARGDQSAVDRGGGRGAAPPSRSGPRWGRQGRAVHLRRLADLIDANIDRIATVECLRHGDAGALAEGRG